MGSVTNESGKKGVFQSSYHFHLCTGIGPFFQSLRTHMSPAKYFFSFFPAISRFKSQSGQKI